MSRLFSPIHRLSERLFQRNYGWTGVEIGSHCINLAQVRKNENRWQLASVWTVEHPTPVSITPLSTATEPNSNRPDESFGWLTADELMEYGLAPSFEHLVNLSGLFRGRNCAATITDGLIAYRELDIPACAPTESQAIIQSEIALEMDCTLEDILTDCWQLPQNRPRTDASCFGAVSIKRSTAMMLASDLLKIGFECQVLDAMPCAMARATSMVLGDCNETTLAIDLGYHQATLTLVQKGCPMLSRGLRELGLFSLLELIANSTEISLSDALTLLFQSSSHRSGLSNADDDFSNPMLQKLGGYIQSLVKEILRTIQFVDRVFPMLRPEQIMLMGAGVRIPAVDQSLENRVGIPTHNWSMDLTNNLFGNQHVGVYAIAAGLSSLAWEGI